MSQQIQCIRCKKQFGITAEDQEFFNKIQLPLPTHCPICRLKRRMIWRNDRVFYRRKCSKSGKPIISIYPENTPFPVYHPSEWYSDGWNPLDFGQDFDYNRPFFEQWQQLMNRVPRIGIDIINCENSDFCNYCGDDKNCYLDIAGEANEDCYYNLFTKYSKNCADCTFAYNSELCYEVINCYHCYNSSYGMYLENCSDCHFCFDLKGCKNCLFSSNLRQKEYYIFNKPCSKEEYEKKVAELKTGSYNITQAAISQWKKIIKDAIHRDVYSINSENCSGNNIKNSKNCHYSFNISDCEDCKYLYDVLEAKDCHDINYSLYKPELSYEIISTLNMRNCAYSMASHYCNEVYYSDQCNNSSYLFGCIGLNRKEYCILNKQYSKEDYEKMRNIIIEHMKKTGEWGEFFPASISPFAYNETVVQEYFPLNREEALIQGFSWKENNPAEYLEQKYAIPESISETPDTICKEILSCQETGKNYRIIPHELTLYKQLKIPVPRKCPDQRHHDRIILRNPRWLWQRNCSKCDKSIHSSYSPKKTEAIYCEQCYLEALH